jgi:hypothetical protein
VRARALQRADEARQRRARTLARVVNNCAAAQPKPSLFP